MTHVSLEKKVRDMSEYNSAYLNLIDQAINKQSIDREAMVIDREKDEKTSNTLWTLLILMKLGLKETAYIIEPDQFSDFYKEKYGV